MNRDEEVYYLSPMAHLQYWYCRADGTSEPETGVYIHVIPINTLYKDDHR